MTDRTLHRLTIGLVAGLIIMATALAVRADEPKAEPLLHEHPTLVAMLTKSNELRQRVGLKPHRMNAKLTKAAQDHANYMAATHTMDHYNNGGYQGRAVRHGFRGFVLENIAMGQPSVDSVFNTWQNSGGHWAAIISNTAEAGFGYQISANGTCFWCSVYGTVKTPDPAWYKPRLVNGVWHCEYSDGTPCVFRDGEWRKG